MDEYSLKKFLVSPFSVKVLPYLLLVFAVLGFLDATYLTIQHYAHAIPPCTVGGCETVLTSTWAVLFGIPVALMGAVFYGVILVLTGLYVQTKKQSLSTMLFVLCSLGFLAGIGLILVQAFVLHAWCYYCLFSELIDFLLFDAAWWLWNSQKNS